MAHKIFVLFLVVISLAAVLSIGVHNSEYYLTPIPERPFRSDYDSLKPSGTYSHGLGIIGATMIIVGVSTYSSRKRIRALWDLGKLSRWLEFHIFLCLLGPTLIIYHTTFKAGGVAAISLWTMLSVAASGIVGRYLYSQIPRSLGGSELTLEQVNAELKRLSESLSTSEIGSRVAVKIIRSFESLPRPENLAATVKAFFQLSMLRLTMRRSVRQMVRESVRSRVAVRELEKSAGVFAAFFQKALVVQQAEKIFHYWHAVHLPFTVIMFITLAAHVTVTLLLGYNWVF